MRGFANWRTTTGQMLHSLVAEQPLSEFSQLCRGDGWRAVDPDVLAGVPASRSHARHVDQLPDELESVPAGRTSYQLRLQDHLGFAAGLVNGHGL